MRKEEDQNHETVIAEPREEHLSALERWLVREVVQRELEPFLSGQEPLFQEKEEEGTGQKHVANTFAGRFFTILLDFPPFRESPEIMAAFSDVFILLPKLDATLRARGHQSKGLKAYLASIISGPILSAARTSRPTDSISNNNPADMAARLLKELRAADQGLEGFLEEVKCAHGINELRPSVIEWLRTLRDSIIRVLLRMSTDSSKRERMQKLYALVPKKMILFMLKSHITGGTLANSIRLVFARPAGGDSILQRIAASSLNHDFICEEIARFQQSTPSARMSSIQRFYCEELQAHDHSLHSDSLERRKSSLRSYVLLESNGEDRFENDQEVIMAIRYLDLLHRKQANQDLLELLGSEKLTVAVSKLAFCTHRVISTSVLAKGSGLVKFVEDLFICVESALDSDATIKQENRIAALVDRLLCRSVALMHNVLLLDRGMLIHCILHWYFQIYLNAAKIELPTDTLLMQLRGSLGLVAYTQILAEARQAFERECMNQEGQIWQPRPCLPLTEAALLPQFGALLRNNLLPTKIEITKRSSGLDNGMEFVSRESGIQSMEVLFNHSENETWGHLSKRKFVCCGRLRCSSVWIRYVSDAPSVVHRLASIVEIALTHEEHSTPLEALGWNVVPKNINKGSIFGGRLFLWFRRARNEEEAQRQILGLEILAKDADERKKDALSKCGYRTVMKVGTGVLQESEVWMLGGVNASIVD